MKDTQAMTKIDKIMSELQQPDRQRVAVWFLAKWEHAQEANELETNRT